MKKYFLVLLALPVVLVSCAKHGDDANLQGVWIGEVKTSNLKVLESVGEASNTNKELVTEGVYYKFEDGKIEIYKSRDLDDSNNVEQEVGHYKAKDGLLSIDIKAHSCANIEGVSRKLRREVPYEISNDFKELKLNITFSKKIILKKVEGTDAVAAENSVRASDVGCLNVGEKAFLKHPLEKPIVEKDLDLEQKLRDLQEETDSELKEEPTLESDEGAAAETSVTRATVL